MRYYGILTVLVVFFCAWQGVALEPEASIAPEASSHYLQERDRALRAQYAAPIKQVEDYLSAFDTMSTRFHQINPSKRGDISQGKLYISRPGKARWEYMHPRETLLVVNAPRLAFYDKTLDQITYGELPNTPLEVLLYKHVTFSPDKVFITDFVMDDYSLTITVKPIESETLLSALTMVFRQFPLKLEWLHRTDENGQVTTVQLIDPKFDQPLDEELFVFKNPRIFEDKRRN